MKTWEKFELEMVSTLEAYGRLQSKSKRRHTNYFHFDLRIDMAKFFRLSPKRLLRMKYARFCKVASVYEYYIYACCRCSTTSHPNDIAVSPSTRMIDFTY